MKGRFKAGHDAKLKSTLVNSALMGDDPEAVERLEQLGWTKFLTKAKESRARRAQPRHVQRKEKIESDTQRARERIKRLQDMTEAANLLREVGRSPEIQVNRNNYQHILDDPLGYEHGDENR